MGSSASEKFQQLQTYFEAVLARPDDEQDQFANELCAGDIKLLQSLTALLSQERLLSIHHTGAVLGDLEQAVRSALPDIVQPSSKFGDFIVLEEIGSGGMGRVYRAQKREHGFSQLVAVKLLRQELLNSALLKRFSDERKILAGLNHAGICRFIDAGTLSNGTPFVVMELVEGHSLFDYCDLQKLAISQRLKLFQKVLAAVTYAHQHLVVHRDLKSGNILVNAGGEPKLLDFGIAKALEGAAIADATATRDRYLSLANAAPEQLLGQTISVACDVYALGTVLYELLSGTAAFDLGKTSAATLEQKILTVPPTPMRKSSDASNKRALDRGLASHSSLQRLLSGELENIVQQCLRKDPSERYSSVEQLDSDIGNYLARRPIRASNGQQWYRFQKFVARNLVACALSGMLLLAVGFGVLAVVARNTKALEERDRAQQALGIMRKAFLSADPARVAGEDVTVRAVLEAALPALDERFESAPALYASLAGTIAEVDLSLGLSTQSAALFERAAQAAARSDLAPQAHFDLLVYLARASYAAGEFDRAEQALASASALGLPRTPEWRVSSAMIMLRKGEATKATEMLLQAVAQMRSRLPDDEWANAARTRLADAWRQLGQHEKSLTVLEEMVAWQLSKLKPEHPRIALSRLQIATQKGLLGQTDSGLTDAKMVLLDLTKTYGPRSPFVARAEMVIGNLYAGVDRNAQAAEHYRNATVIFNEVLGASHPNALRNAFNLAQVLYADQKSSLEAGAIYKSTLELAEIRFGSQSNATIMFRNGYINYLLDQQHTEAAMAQLLSKNASDALAIADAQNAEKYSELLKRAAEQLNCGKPKQANLPSCANALTLMARLSKP